VDGCSVAGAASDLVVEFLVIQCRVVGGAGEGEDRDSGNGPGG
jgi:hypothetical protein